MSFVETIETEILCQCRCHRKHIHSLNTETSTMLMNVPLIILLFRITEQCSVVVVDKE